MTENPGYCSGSFDGLHHSSDDDDDDMVDIAGATLDFSSTDDVPPLNSGKAHGWTAARKTEKWKRREMVWFDMRRKNRKLGQNKA